MEDPIKSAKAQALQIVQQGQMQAQIVFQTALEEVEGAGKAAFQYAGEQGYAAGLRDADEDNPKRA